MKLLKIGGVLAIAILSALAVANEASAALTINSLVGGAAAGTNYANFDNLPSGPAGGSSGGITVTFNPDGKAVQGAASGLYAPPVLSNGNGAPFGNPLDGVDTTTYLTTGLGSITMQLPGLEMYLGLLWGSVDAYNTLKLYNGATLVGTVTGVDVNAAANGDQGVNGTFYVNIISDLAFDKVVAESSRYAFEIDNVAYSETLPVPEPASMAIFLAGLIGAVVLGRRRQKGLIPA